MSSIVELENRVDNLSDDEKKLFFRIFDISSSNGRLNIPNSFRDKAVGYFHDVGKTEDDIIRKLEKQEVVKTFNKWTLEGTLINDLRASRPGMKPGEKEKIRKQVDEHVDKARKNCDLCEPKKYTPEDVFGRIEGGHCIIGCNIAKYDAWNSMIYFDEHHPLEFNREELSDYIETAFRWFKKVHETDKEAEFPFLMWNCLEKAGASRIHGHLQVLMTRNRPYAKVMVLRNASEQYKDRFGRNYFDDLFNVHDSLDLGLQNGDSKVFVYLTPIKEKETFIVAPSKELNDVNGRRDLRDSVFKVLRCFIDKLGVHSFNVAISMPPVTDKDSDFPYVTRIIDRGNIFKKTSDMGTMELYGDSVVSTNPYEIIKALRNYF